MTKTLRLINYFVIILAIVGMFLVFTSNIARAQTAVPAPPTTNDAIANNPLGAACTASPGAVASPGCEKGSDNPVAGSNGIITKIIRLVQIAAVIMSTIMIILGGYTYVMSSGDPQKIKSAKDTILFALIGLAVAATAQGIISFVLNKL